MVKQSPATTLVPLTPLFVSKKPILAVYSLLALLLPPVVPWNLVVEQVSPSPVEMVVKKEKNALKMGLVFAPLLAPLIPVDCIPMLVNLLIVVIVKRGFCVTISLKEVWVCASLSQTVVTVLMEQPGMDLSVWLSHLPLGLALGNGTRQAGLYYLYFVLNPPSSIFSI